jgi:nucleoside phosphorylase
MPSRKLKADIGVITVIPEELAAARRSLGISESDRQKGPAGRIYYFGEVARSFAQRPYRIALTCIGTAGTTACAATTSALIHTCHPRFVILVGIAAGVREKTKIGSVILSERVWDYETQALHTGRRGRIQKIPRPNVHQLPFGVVQDITDYLSRSDELTERIARRFLSVVGTSPKQKLYKDKPTVAGRPEVGNATVASGINCFAIQDSFTVSGRAVTGESK